MSLLFGDSPETEPTFRYSDDMAAKGIEKIPHLRPGEYKRSRLPRNRRTVNRSYGRVLSGGAVRERIIQAFLVE
ncbi:hypothetical protein K1719_031173 [Acacia pycnantha]|nr:hypothetical protein K1719_031173 [Acacia pycnantha]